MKNVPEIRFKGFTDAWEQRKFNTLVNRVSKTNSENILPRVEFEDIISGSGRLNKNLLKKRDFKNGIEFEEGDVLFGKLRPYLKNWLLPDFNGVAVGDFWVLRPNENDSSFIYYLIQSDDFQIVANLSTGTKMPRSDWGVVSETEFGTPCVAEQTLIGTFFRTLDNTIAIYKRKLDGLRELKKAYLQMMFPQEGEVVPRVRFEGFSEDWESIELGNVFEQTARYVNPKEKNIELWSLTVENGLTPKTERYNREFLVKKDDAFKSVKPDEFIYNPMNMTLGAVDLNTTGNEVAVSGYYITMQTKQGYNNNYFAVWLKSPMAINLYKTYATGGLIEKQRVQFLTLAQIKVVTPSFFEQEAIGNFFNSLDLQIVTLSKKAEKLAQLKNAYLQKMFV